jgi:hypothetical protein
MQRPRFEVIQNHIIKPSGRVAVKGDELKIVINSRESLTSTFVDGTRPATNATLVNDSISAAYAVAIKNVAVAIALTFGNAVTATNATQVLVQTRRVGGIHVVACQRVNAVVNVVTNQIVVDVEETVAVADAQDIYGANTVVNRIANVVKVKITEGAVVLTIGSSVTVGVVVAIELIFVVVADAILVQVQAVVHVVTNAIGIGVGKTVATAHSDRIKQGAIAVACT